MLNNRFHDARLSAITIVSCLLLTSLYYLLTRIGTDLPAVLQGFAPLQRSSAPVDPTLGSAPTFLHAVATLVAVAYWQGRTAASRNTVWITGALAVTALFGMEFSIGVPDLADSLAILVAAIVVTSIHQPLPAAQGVAPRAPSSCAVSGDASGRIIPNTAMALLFGVSILGALGSVPYQECALYGSDGTCTETKRAGNPVYMSYAALRSAVAVEPPRPLDRLGRLYVYGDYLFVNERNEGIHVIDNREPAKPVNVGFIRIPGNMEINIRNSYLYADSYVDLVTLDLSDPLNVREVSRQENTFPYDAFQNIPYNISFSQTVLDQNRGVVVSYVE